MFCPLKSARNKSTRVIALSCATLASLAVSTGQVTAQQKQTPLFYDARRLPDMEVERRNQEVLTEQRRVAEERRAETEATAKRIASEAKAQEARVAAEAVVKKKADDARTAAAEADAKKKADDARIAAAEADAKKKADDARIAAADAQRKVDEEKRLAAASIAATPTSPSQRGQPQIAALAPQITSPPSPGTSCEPTKAKTSQLAGGRMRISIDSPCRKGQSVALRYGSYEFGRKLDNAGRANIDLDLFQGNTISVGLSYTDGHSESLQPAARDLAEFWKVALIWQAPVDLDLHAMENGALNGKAGHVWSNAASTAEAAKAQAVDTGRGAGFLSMSDDGSHEGTKIEVYTFFHTSDQPSGVVSMLLDYVTRGNNPTGEFCGTGAKASIPYEAVILSPKGITSRERGVVSPAACGVPLAPSARLIRDAVPDLQFGQ